MRKYIKNKYGIKEQEIQDVKLEKLNLGRFLPNNPEEIFGKSDIKIPKRKAPGVPAQVTNLEVTVNNIAINGRNFNQLDIRFIQPSDVNFAGARVLIKGYNTNNELGNFSTTKNTVPFTEFARVTNSPATVLLELTAEDVVIGVQAFNSEGLYSPIEKMPTKQTTLN